MLASIHPLGERARHSRWGVTVGAHIVGAAAGGVVAGTLAGTLGWAVHEFAPWAPRSAAVAALLLGAAGAAFDLVPWLRLPSPRRQVNEDWLNRYRGWVYGLGFGFQLGLGVATIVTTALVYVVWGMAFLSASAVAGALIGVAFGAARGATVLAPARVRRPDELRRFHRRLAGLAPAARRVAAAAQVGLVLLASVILL